MSKLEAPVNPNYAATVVRVNHINVLPNCDNVVGVPFFGMQAIVGKDVQVGDIGILFLAESQLSDEYTRKNGLYRHSDKNENETQSGYIEDSRRVKALKFRGHQSDALFMPIESLDYVTKNKTMREGLALEVGDVFDKLMGQEICRKYLVKQPGVLRVDKNASQNNALDTVKHGKHHNAIKTHCKHGHEFTSDNLVPSKIKVGRRNCLTCSRGFASKDRI